MLRTSGRESHLHFKSLSPAVRMQLVTIFSLQNLENLLERVDTSLEVDEELLAMDESYVRDSFARLNDSRRRLADATRERIASLSRAVADCERFEKQMADIQQWSAHVSTLLDLRKSGDVSALDVPDEYKVLSHSFQQEL